MSIIGNPLLLGGGDGGGSVVVWDELDSHGGTIRHIEADEVYGLEEGSATPSTSQQVISPTSGKYFSKFTVAAMPAGTAGTPTASKGSVSNHSVQVTPSVTNIAGYVESETKTGTPVSVSASELVSGKLEINENGDDIDVTNYQKVKVAVPTGGGGISVAMATSTPASASSSIQFTGLQDEPTSFVVVSSSDLATGASPYKTAAVVFDGTDIIGQYITNTSNAQMTFSDSAFSKSYSNGTLTITGSGTNFQANEYTLLYTYGGSSANVGTQDVQVGSGATSISFTGLTEEPTCWSLIFKDNIGTSSGYTRAHVVVNDGSEIYGMEMGSGSSATSNWTATYNNGTLTISSQSTSAGGYFHQPGYYQLTYVIGGTVEITTESLSVTENGTYTAPHGKAYTPVSVNVSGGGSAQIDTKTVTASNRPSSLSFTNMKGQPKAFFLKATFTMTSSSTTYYYVDSIRYNGTNTEGRLFRMGSTRQTEHVTSGYSSSYSNGTLTVSSTGNRTTSPGCFYNGDYELVYIY